MMKNGGRFRCAPVLTPTKGWRGDAGDAVLGSLTNN